MSDVLFGHADGALSDFHYDYPGQIENPYRLNHFRALLNVHLLLYRRLVIPDDFALHSYYLRHCLINDYDKPQGHSAFLSDGSLRIAFRDNAPSPAMATAYFLSTGTYNQPAYEQIGGYVDFLEDFLPARHLTYDHDERYEVQHDIIRGMLSSRDYLEAAGARSTAKVVKRAIGSKGDAITRSWFWLLADKVEVGDRQLAQDLRLFSSAALHMTIPKILGLAPVYPAPISRFVRALSPIRLDPLAKVEPASKRFVVVADAAGVDGRGFADLSIDALKEARASKSFKTLQSEFKRIEQLEQGTAGFATVKAIDHYFTGIRDIIALDLAGQRIKARQLARISRFAIAAGVAGGLAAGGAGLIVPLSDPVDAGTDIIGLVWGLASAGLPIWLDRKVTSLKYNAHRRALDNTATSNKGSLQLGGLL